MVKITGWFTKANPRKWTFGQKLCEAATKLFPYMGIISEMLECTRERPLMTSDDFLWFSTYLPFPTLPYNVLFVEFILDLFTLKSDVIIGRSPIVKSIIRKVDGGGGGASGLAQWLWWVGDIWTTTFLPIMWLFLPLRSQAACLCTLTGPAE